MGTGPTHDLLYLDPPKIVGFNLGLKILHINLTSANVRNVFNLIFLIGCTEKHLSHTQAWGQISASLF